MKIIRSILLLVCISSSLNVFSQSDQISYKWKAPLLTFDITGFFDIPVGAARGNGSSTAVTNGNVSEFFKFNNYGTGLGVGFKIDSKIAVNKKRNFLVYLSLGFEQIQGDDTLVYISPNTLNGYPLSGSNTYGTYTGSGTSRIVIRNLYAGLGLEFVYKPDKPISFFIGSDFNLDYLYGFYMELPNITNSYTYYSINGAVRFGLNFNTGLQMRITNNIGFLLGFKYHITNLFNKSSSATNNNSMNLLDAAAPNLNSNLNKDRLISIFQPYLGFSLSFGFKK